MTAKPDHLRTRARTHPGRAGSGLRSPHTQAASPVSHPGCAPLCQAKRLSLPHSATFRTEELLQDSTVPPPSGYTWSPERRFVKTGHAGVMFKGTRKCFVKMEGEVGVMVCLHTGNLRSLWSSPVAERAQSLHGSFQKRVAPACLPSGPGLQCWKTANVFQASHVLC